MTPFLQFRIWARRASAAQLAATVLAASAALALIIWAAVPSARSIQSVGTGGLSTGASASSNGAGGTGPGGNSTGAVGSSSGLPGSSKGAGSTGGGSGGTGPVGGSGGGSGSGGTGSGSGATQSGGTTPVSSVSSPGGNTTTGGTSQTGAAACSKMGVLKIGVALPEAAGGTLNSIVRAPPVADEEADYSAVFDSVNKAGGVACYDLSPDYFQADETNPSSVQSGCLKFVQDKVFAVLGGFEPASPDTCLLQNHLATIEQLSIPAGDAHQYYPYYLAADATYETLYKNFVDASNQLGYFGTAKHFKKLGIFYRDCSAEVNRALLADLAAVGISGSKVDTVDLGCPAEFASTTTIESGILRFKNDGVTTVTFDNDIIDIQNISNQAASANFYPFWDFPDDGAIAITASANFHPNSSEFNNAVSISDLAYGAIDSHLPLTPGTVACNKIMSSHGLVSVYQSPDNFAGSTCSLIWLLVAGIQHGGANPASLAAGLQAAKSVQISYPNGPNDFSAPGTTTGGEYWRPVTYHSSCQCWTVIKPDFSPSFQ
jgi:hypothetical protein